MVTGEGRARGKLGSWRVHWPSVTERGGEKCHGLQNARSSDKSNATGYDGVSQVLTSSVDWTNGLTSAFPVPRQKVVADARHFLSGTSCSYR